MIAQLLKDLQAVPSTETYKNPYLEATCLHNLEVYLKSIRGLPYSGHLLVGEALGYRGGALTGIPFTSPRLLRAHLHPFIKTLRPSLAISGNVAEATATMVWDHLESCSAVPALWNVFPFHPHKPGSMASNRTPNSQEKERGRRFLDRLLKILSPHVVIAVGRVAEAEIAKWYPELQVAGVRHPSHGGRKSFVAGLKAAGIC